MKNLSLPLITGLFDSPIELHRLLDHLPMALAILDTERRMVFLNRAIQGLTGFREEEVRGIPCAYILRANICQFKCPLLNPASHSEIQSCEGDIINRDHHKVPVRITYAPVKTSGGKLKGFLEAVEDLRFAGAIDKRSAATYGFGELVGRSPQMERIFHVLPMIAQSDSSVLITGETGTGKDLLAEAIHQASQRAKGPFVKVNCGALPETLMESELFGHQKGAFTGAVGNKPGRFQLAHNGSLYLTEIGDLPLPLQVKLLTFLDDRVVYPLGSTRGFAANVRVIAATHRNLEKMVREGRFREDLLFRLNVVRLHLPPLRERQDDVRLLLDHFLNGFTTEFRKPLKGFSAKALRILLDYSYPGNVRELKNIAEYALNICQEEYIGPKHLPSYLTEGRVHMARTMDVVPMETPSIATGAGSLEAVADWGTLEQKMILDALLRTGGRRGRAADLLGWGRSTLWRKMKQYGLESHASRGEPG
ncbi:MAG: sigma 54-interacting transcriptional regulator [Deltaproteobacteria bacterium]|nr:sigma 54-interacting transcriptional regulator [Deltaproteobacteria bacterium]